MESKLEHSAFLILLPLPAAASSIVRSGVLFDGPAHILPSLSALYDKLMSDLLPLSSSADKADTATTTTTTTTSTTTSVKIAPPLTLTAPEPSTENAKRDAMDVTRAHMAELDLSDFHHWFRNQFILHDAGAAASGAGAPPPPPPPQAAANNMSPPQPDRPPRQKRASFV